MVAKLAMPGVGDARLAVHAAGNHPAWLWTTDGSRVLWANPVGAQLFGARNAVLLAANLFGPADQHRRQIAQLAPRLPLDAPARLERMRGFGAPLGRLMTCACSRLALVDEQQAILIVALEASGRVMPLAERLKRLVEDSDMPLAAFGHDGVFVGASDSARALSGFRSLSEAGLERTRETALRDGRAETPVGVGRFVLQRVGSGADMGLIAMLEPAAIAVLQAGLSDSKGVTPAARAEAEKVESDLPSSKENPPEYAPNSPVGVDALAEENAATQENAASEVEHHAVPQAASQPIEPAPEPISELPPWAEPLRFVWTVDAHGHFTIRSEELEHLLGLRGTSSLDAGGASLEQSAIDVDGRLATAIATRAPWSGVRVVLPAGALECDLSVELSGVPLFDPNGFAGYRGFGICHDLPALTRLQARRQRETRDDPAPRSLSAHSTAAPSSGPPFQYPQLDYPAEVGTSSNDPSSSCQENSAADPPKEVDLNVVSLRPVVETPSPALTTVESDAFDELARELSARLDNDAPAAADEPNDAQANGPAAQPENPTENAQPAAKQSSSFSGIPESEMYALLDGLNEALLIVNRLGVVEFANRAAATLFEPNDAPLQQRKFIDVLNSSSAAHVNSLLDLRDGANVESEVQTVHGLRLRLRVLPAPGQSIALMLHDPAVQDQHDAELAAARRDAACTSAAKADTLSRISTELCVPLRAILGFTDAILGERFGALGDARYAALVKDIRGCAEHGIAVLKDLSDLASVESRRRDLDFTRQDLNTLVEQCVAAMQPQANRERIIIRCSLVHGLPSVMADSRALRQIVINLIGNSIHLAKPGGQVIVSTAASQEGDVTLRVRDSGLGHNDNSAGNSPDFVSPLEETEKPTAIRLSLTRALMEANGGRFSIKAAPHGGTLIEIAFAADAAHV